MIEPVTGPAPLPPARLEVRLLGTAAVTLDGEPLEAFESVRLCELLARLILEPNPPLRRSTLAFEIWPESADTQARTNLRHLLFDLRRALPDAEQYVHITHTAVAWRDDAPARIDVLAFLDACRNGAAEKAVACYGGELLPGSYSDFIADERQRLTGMAANCLRELAAGAVAANDDEAAVAWGHRLLASDPFSEPAYRLLMGAHARLGERATAVRLYHSCVEVLAAELGIEPSAETRRLYSALAAESSAGGTELESTEPGMSVKPTRRLVGRDAERRIALDCWRETSRGRSRLLVATGEAGVGKTRLIEELAHRAETGGAGVARARAYETAGRPPWAPVADWLRSDAVSPALRRLPPSQQRALARLVPELGAQMLAQPDDGDSARRNESRRRLLDAIGRALSQVGPLVLVFDDLQWCDADTLGAVAFLIRSFPTAPLLVAASLRDELAAGHPVNGLLDDLRRDDLAVTIALDRLDAGAAAELARQVGHRPVDSETARRLFASTAGNPLFIIEATRAGLSRDGGMPVTPTVRAVIRSRLNRLSRAALDLLDVAAIFGRDFSIDELAAAMRLNADALVEPLDELWRHRIFAEHRGAYDFTHDVIREVARGAINPARRRRLHRDAARGLLAVHGHGPGPLSGRLAAHFEQAGLPSEAIGAWRRAASWALGVFALDDAIEFLRRALYLVGQLAAGLERDTTELDVREELGVPIITRDGYASADAQAVYDRALALARRIGRPVPPPVLRGLGLGALARCRFARATRLAETLLAAGDADPTAPAEAHYLGGVSAFWQGRFAQAREHLAASLASYRMELGPAHRARYGQDPRAVCLIRLALTQWFSGQAGPAGDAAVQALDYARSLEHAMTESYVLLYAQMLSIEAERPDRVERLLDAADRLAERRPVEWLSAPSKLHRAWVGFRRGERTAPRRLRAVVKALRAGDQPLHFTHALTLLARAYLETARIDEGRSAVAEALAWGERHDQRYLEAELLRIDGALLAAAGELDEAVSATSSGFELARRQAAPWLALRAAYSLAELAPSAEHVAKLRGALAALGHGATPESRRATRLLASL